MTDTRKCACGTLMPKEWPDCGATACVLQTQAFDRDRPRRTERFRDIYEVIPYNREVDAKRAGIAQQAAVTTAKRLMRLSQHEAIVRTHELARNIDQIEADQE